MAKMVRIDDRDIAEAVRRATSGSREVLFLRNALEMLVRSASGSTISLDYIARALHTLEEFFISPSTTRKIVAYFEELYDEQQESS